MHEILIADDHPLFLDAIKSVIQDSFPDAVVHTVEDYSQAWAVAESNPNLTLIMLDLKMPGMDGLQGIIKMRNEFPEFPIVVISAEGERNVVVQAISYGAVGYISKSTPRDKIQEALHQIFSGQVYLPPDIIRASNKSSSTSVNKEIEIDPRLIRTLTRRQLLVFERLAKGESNKQIANEMNIAETTVKAHVSAIFSKIGVSSRIQAVLSASNIDFNQYLR